MITPVAEVVDIIMSDDGHNTDINHSRGKKAMIKNSKDGTKREKTVEIRRWGKKNVHGFSGVTLFEKTEREREWGREREGERRDGAITVFALLGLSFVTG